ncbi:DUF2238 domain-containing protein [Pseudomonas guariconensis]|uniref:DUF2238 domain-containing protein n=1 Tax=Pseudomonas guariconensis TaxID=1288410 RepID=UPI0034D5D181
MVRQSIRSPATPAQALALLLLALAMIVVSGVAPAHRADWLMENIVPLALLLALVSGWRWLRLSPSAYVAIVLLFAIHELGAHYTYAQVPYDRWAKAVSGHSLDAALGWQRNQYDRLVHLSYGLLFYRPLRETLWRLTVLRGAWLVVLTLTVVLATSALYELIEWVGGQYVGKDTAQAFVATQRDPWDAQKDMALALLGALTSSVLGGLWRAWRDRRPPMQC